MPETDEKLSQPGFTSEDLQMALDNLLEGCQVIGFDWCYKYLNKAAEVHNRRPNSELTGRRYMDMWPGIETTEVFRLINQTLFERIPNSLQNKFTFPDGQSGWFELKIRPVPEGVFILSIDITKAKENELEVIRLNRMYAMLSQTNQVIVRITDRNKLFSAICSIAIDFGGFSLAWIGEKHQEDVSFTGNYLAADGSMEIDPMQITAHANVMFTLLSSQQERGQRIVVYNDTKNELVPGFSPDWLDSKGIRSLAASLIYEQGNELGILVLFHNEPGFFGLKESLLLQEVAGDISFALDNIENSRKRMAAEEAVTKSEEKYRMIADHAEDWIYFVLADGSISYISPSFTRLTGYSTDHFSHHADLMKQLVLPDDRHLVEHHNTIQNLIPDEHEVEFRIMAKDGTLLWISHKCAPVYGTEGTFLGRRGTNRDITVRKAAEELVVKLNTTLEERVHERTLQLVMANKELEAFSYSVSHDLRAPLRGIHGFTQILIEDYSERLDEEGKRICSVIKENAQRMSQLIDDLLELARIGRQEINYREISMNSMVTEVFRELSESSGESTIEFKSAELGSIFADPILIRLVWLNLISNAIKYSSNNEHPIIEVSVKFLNGMAEFCVSDNGVGFDPAHHGKLFEVFERLHSAREYPGTGVGLAIVKRIVERHGGSVRAESQPGEGARFFFSLPTDPIITS